MSKAGSPTAEKATSPQTFSVTTGPLPASRKIHVGDLRVPMREIALSKGSGEPPFMVYDTSGPFTAPAVTVDIYKGLPKLREQWILARGDVESYIGRKVKPEDNGKG